MARRFSTIEDDLRRGTLPQGYELTATDVGRTFSLAGWGKVLAVDVGKRVWRRSYGLTMDSNEQRDAPATKTR